MDDVVSRRVAGHGAFRRDRGLQRSDIRLCRRFLRVLRIPRERQEPYRRQNGEYRDYDDEFHESEPLQFCRPDRFRLARAVFIVRFLDFRHRNEGEWVKSSRV